MRCMPSFSKNLFLASKNNDDTKTILACSFVTQNNTNVEKNYLSIKLSSNLETAADCF